MQQRRVRLGDIVDDYCPRERRITNHAVVAMIDDTVKQTRCTTCDADHEYRDAKIPSPRRRKPGAADGVLVDARPRRVPVRAEQSVSEDLHDEPVDVQEPASDSEPMQLAPEAPAADADAADTGDIADTADTSDAPGTDRDEWPVHRPLIRATLPRPEGQTPERKTPDFTFRPAGGRFDPHRNGQRKGGHRPTRHAHGQPSGGQGRFGGPRTGSGPRHGAGHASGQSQGQRQGNRSGSGGNRPGPNRGPRAGGGRKRGR